jgi:hypothetical protein
MNQKQIKTDCKVTISGQSVPAFLHLVEIQYSSRITFWNGVLQVAGNLPGGGYPCVAGIALPDGRTGSLRLTHFDVQEGYLELAGSGSPNAA